MKIAIVGCGLIGCKRAEALAPRTLLYACDVQLSKAEALASLVPGCTATTELNRVISDPAVSAVIVSATNAALAPIALSAVRHGKDVLVEKPGALSSIELSEIEREASDKGVRVRIGYNHRYHPAFLKVFDLIRTEDLGELMFLRARYGHGGRIGYEREWRADPKLSGGGELIDQGVHLIDLALYLMGEFSIVEGHASTCFWDMPVDDNSFVSLRTADGKTAWIHVSCTEWKNLFSFEIYFKRAKLHVEGLGGSYGLEKLSYYRMLPEMGPPETTIFEFPRPDQSWKLELDGFLEDIRLHRNPNPGPREGKRVLEIVERIYETSGYKF